MQRLLLSVVFAVGLLSLPALASAQESGDIRWGVTGGASLENVQSSAERFDNASESQVGFQAGIEGVYQLVEIFAVNPELVFARRGWDTNGTALGQTFNANYNFSYLSLPVLFEASAEVADGIRPKLFAGPSASLFLDGSQDGSPDPFSGAGDEIDGDQVNDIQFGGVAGVGANFDIGRLTLTSDVRYQRNLTGIFENTPENVDSIEHESFQLTLGFLF